MKAFFKKWWHALLGLYALIYMPCFTYLEKHVIDEYHLIHCGLDDKIPFCEYFIIPYFFWFAFIAIACVYFFFKSQEECVRMGLYLIIGMSTAIIIYFVFPNGLGSIRPTEFPRDNFCTDMVKFLYKSDTSTNVLPSLHVFNTLVVVIAVFKSKTFKRPKLMRTIVSVIAVFICLSTVFLKQHSVYDLLAAVALILILYPLIYKNKLLSRCFKHNGSDTEKEGA